MDALACPRCNTPLAADAVFCSHCGNKLRNSLSTSWGKQATIYIVSFFLAPFGLGYVFTYLKSGGEAERRIGYIALALTIIAIIAEIWSGVAFFNAQIQTLHDLGL